MVAMLVISIVLLVMVQAWKDTMTVTDLVQKRLFLLAASDKVFALIKQDIKKIGGSSVNMNVEPYIAAPGSLDNPSITFFMTDKNEDGELDSGDEWIGYELNLSNVSRRVYSGDTSASLTLETSKDLLMIPGVAAEELTFCLLSTAGNKITNPNNASEVEVSLTLSLGTEQIKRKVKFLLYNLIYGGG